MSEVAVALGVPLAAGVALLALVDWAWMPIAGVVLIGGAGVLLSWIEETDEPRPYSLSTGEPTELLQRLCMRADMVVPDLVVEHDARGRTRGRPGADPPDQRAGRAASIATSSRR